jgi:predicted transcriptional regulator
MMDVDTRCGSPLFKTVCTGVQKRRIILFIDAIFVVAEKGKNMVVHLRKRERDRVTIIAEILDLARDGVLKTNIMWKARLNHFMLDGYLGTMMKARLLEKVLSNNRVVFKTTGKGMEFLYHCQEILELLETEDSRHGIRRTIQLLPNSLSPQSLQRLP